MQPNVKKARPEENEHYYFYRHVDNSIKIKTAAYKGNLWKLEFQEDSQQIHELSLFSFKGLSAAFENIWSYLTGHYEEKKQNQYQHLLNHNYTILTDEVAKDKANNSYKKANNSYKTGKISSTPTYKTTDLKLAVQAAQGNEFLINTLQNEIDKYIELFSATTDQNKFLEPVKDIVKDHDWKLIDPFELQEVFKKYAYSENQQQIRSEYSSFYINASKLFHNIVNKDWYPSKMKFYLGTLIDRDEMYYASRFYDSNKNLAQSLRTKYFTPVELGQIKTFLASKDPFTFLSPEILHKVVTAAQNSFPEFFNDQNGKVDTSKLNQNDYAFKIICDILAEPENPIQRENLPNLLKYVQFLEGEMHNLYTTRQNEILNGRPGSVKEMSLKLNKYLKFDELENPTTIESFEKARRAIHVFMPELDFLSACYKNNKDSKNNLDQALGYILWGTKWTEKQYTESSQKYIAFYVNNYDKNEQRKTQTANAIQTLIAKPLYKQISFTPNERQNLTDAYSNTKDLALKLHEILEFDKKKDTPLTKAKILTALNALNSIMPDLNLAFEPNPYILKEKQEFVSKALGWILWGEDMSLKSIEDGLFFSVDESKQWIQNNTIDLPPGQTYQEYFMLNMNYNNFDEYKRFQELISGIPYEQLEKVGIVYRTTDQKDHLSCIKIGDKDYIIPVARYEQKQNGVSVQGQVNEKDTAKLTKDFIKTIKNDLEDYILKDPSILRPFDFKTPLKDDKELIKYLRALWPNNPDFVDEKLLYELTKVSDNLFHAINNLPIDALPLKTLTNALQLIYAHLLTFFMQQKQLIKFEAHVHQFILDMFRRNSRDVILPSGVKIFEAKAKGRTKEDFKKSALALKINFKNMLKSASLNDLEILKKRAEFWEKSTLVPKNLTHKNFEMFIKNAESYKSADNQDSINTFLDNLRLDKDELEELTKKTSFSEDEINGIYYNQTLQMMLVTQQGTESLHESVPINTKRGVNKRLNDQKSKMLENKNDEEVMAPIGGDNCKIRYLDASMSSYEIEGRVPFKLGTKENPGEAVIPVMTSHWKYKVHLNPADPNYTSAVESIVDDNVGFSPYMLHFINNGTFEM